VLEDGEPMSKGNYVSVKNNVAIIEKQFKQEQAEGLMQEVPYATAKKEFGSDLFWQPWQTSRSQTTLSGWYTTARMVSRPT
jgi:hypothetical protein